VSVFVNRVDVIIDVTVEYGCMIVPFVLCV